MISTFCSVVLLASFPPEGDLPRTLADERDYLLEEAGAAVDERDLPNPEDRLLLLSDPQGARSAAKGFFGRMEGNVFAGVVIPDSDFKNSASWSAGVLARLPAPGLPTGRFGIFGQALVSHLDRNLQSFYSNRSGFFYTGTVGLDFKLYEDQAWWLLAQAGGVYAYFGNIAGLDSGFGGELGLMAGIHFIKRDTTTSITLNPQFIHDGTDWILFVNVGLQILF